MVCSGLEAGNELPVQAERGHPVADALLRAGRSGVDVVLEYGQRGSLDDHGLEESFLRLGVGFRTFEQWRRDRPDN